jgi:chromosome segregation ATPase
VKDLSARFSEVERRVSALVAENGQLRKRVRELEQERQEYEAKARESEVLRRRTEQVRDRLQRLLAALESVEREVTRAAEEPERRKGEGHVG